MERIDEGGELVPIDSRDTEAVEQGRTLRLFLVCVSLCFGWLVWNIRGCDEFIDKQVQLRLEREHARERDRQLANPGR